MATIGYIYIALNPAMVGMLKIGKTSRPPEQRTEELSAPTGVPCPFHVACEVQVTDMDEAEKHLHTKFAAQRVNKSREFFSVSLLTAIDAVLELKKSSDAALLANTAENVKADCTKTSEARNISRGSESMKGVTGSPQNSYTLDSRIPFCIHSSAPTLPLKEEPSFAADRPIVRAYLAAKDALESGDSEQMTALIKGGVMSRELRLEAAKLGRADVCFDLARGWPERDFIGRLSLFWIAASAGDATAAEEVSSWWHVLQPAQKAEMQEFAFKLNPKFELTWRPR